MSDSNQSVLKSFQLFINSSKLLLPTQKYEPINAVAGASVQIPCVLLNPTEDSIDLKLVSLSTGQELPNVIRKEGNKGFEILSARLPEHNGEVECQAKTLDGRSDSVRVNLVFNPFGGGGDIIVPPDDCVQCYELQKPHINLENGHDIHFEDSVNLQCSLVVPKGYESRVQLEWLVLSLGGKGSENFNVTKTTLPQSPGYVELNLINHINKVKSGGPFRCTATLLDENGRVFEARSEEIYFNLVQFDNDEHAIEWHKDAFNEIILVEEGQPVKWVIGFTIHRKDRQKVQQTPMLDFIRVDYQKSLFKGQTKRDERALNRFVLTLELDHVEVSDMGQYELRVHDDELGSVFEPSLPMFLYVKGKPRVTFEGQNPQGFYQPGEEINFNCSVLSYPINETRSVFCLERSDLDFCGISAQ